MKKNRVCPSTNWTTCASVKRVARVCQSFSSKIFSNLEIFSSPSPRPITTQENSQRFLPPDRRLPEIWNIVLSRRRRRARAVVRARVARAKFPSIVSSRPRPRPSLACPFACAERIFNLIIRFVPSRPSIPESSSTRPRLARRTFSLARVHSR